MARFRVLVTSRSFASVSDEPIKILEEAGCELVETPRRGPFSEDELKQILSATHPHAIILGTDPINASVLDSAPELKVVSKHGVGVDNVDIPAATARGVAVTITPRTNVDAVADLAMGLMLAVARRIVPADSSVRAGQWKSFLGTQVWRKTLGIIGLGAIGRAVAARAKGFQMKVLAYDPLVTKDAAAEAGAELVPLDDLLREADFVTVHVPLNDSTKGLISARELGLMKPTAYVLNTARGGIVDEKALVEALDVGKIAGAAVDVFSEEPPSQDMPLLKHPKVVLTPHIGAYTNEAINGMSVLSARNVVDVLLGNPCPNVVNKLS